MITITTPNESFNGVRAGLQFRSGGATAEALTTEQRRALTRLGYSIDEPPQEPLAPPALADMTVAQLREVAAERGVDLAGLKNKPEILEAVLAAGAARELDELDKEATDANDEGDEKPGDEGQGDSGQE